MQHGGGAMCADGTGLAQTKVMTVAGGPVRPIAVYN